ncbi:MAG: CheR family methyltransferase [Polyangia bacterium]
MNPTDLISVQRLRQLVARGLGLELDIVLHDELQRILDERVKKKRIGDRTLYLDSLLEDREELRVLASLLTTGETYFFRNHGQLDAFSEASVPARMRARSEERTLRILSAGSSSGEEAYTLAMLLTMHAPIAGWNVEIVGFDVNPTAIAKARRARYSKWALRETPEHVLLRFFEKQGDEYEVIPEIRRMVRFEESNLLHEDSELWQHGRWDVVFCRNVMMYFSPETMKSLVERFAKALVTDGYFFLGHAETLRGVSHSFHLHHSHEAFYYQRASEPGRDLSPAFDGQTWVNVIAKASGRIADITAPKFATPLPVPQPPPGLDVAIELLREERYAEAMLHLQAMSEAARREPAAALIEAVLLTNRGDLDGAEAVCRRLLELDELDAEAHYLIAFGCNQRGDHKGAIDHGRTAAYLDPTFAMPRLQLGLLAKRSGDLDAARRELDKALTLLDEESETRVLLFGGGFSREGLVRLCVAERQSLREVGS